MALQDLAVFMGHYKVTITEAPSVKMKRQKDGSEVPDTDRAGNVKYVVSVFVKPRRTEDGRTGKGDEIKVNLGTQMPAGDFDEGDRVELVNPVVNMYELRDDSGVITGTGLWWKASGLKPVVREQSLPRAA